MWTMCPASRLIVSISLAVALVGCSGIAGNQANGSRDAAPGSVAGSVPKPAKAVPLKRAPAKSPQEPKSTEKAEDPKDVEPQQDGEKVVETESSHGPIKVTVTPLGKDPKPITPSAAPPKAKSGSGGE